MQIGSGWKKIRFVSSIDKVNIYYLLALINASVEGILLFLLSNIILNDSSALKASTTNTGLIMLVLV